MAGSPPHPSARLLGCLQGKHRFLFLLFKQSGRVTVRPPSKRQGFQARAGLAHGATAPSAPALHWQLGNCGITLSKLSDPTCLCPQVRAFAQEHNLGNPAAGLFVWAQNPEE